MMTNKVNMWWEENKQDRMAFTWITEEQQEIHKKVLKKTRLRQYNKRKAGVRSYSEEEKCNYIWSQGRTSQNNQRKREDIKVVNDLLEKLNDEEKTRFGREEVIRMGKV